MATAVDAKNRLKGINTRIVLSGPDGIMFTLALTKGFSATFLRQILEEQYLGAITPSFDEIDMGVALKISEFHIKDDNVFAFIDMVGKRARREIPATTMWTATSTFDFDDGKRRRIIIPDLHFGDQTVDVSDRAAYVKSGIDAKAEQAYFKAGRV